MDAINAINAINQSGRDVHHMFEFRYIRGHVEVYDQCGSFVLSADSECEAREDLREDGYSV